MTQNTPGSARVAVLDPRDDWPYDIEFERLAAAGIHLDLTGRIGDARILLTHGARVDEAVISVTPRLRHVITYSVGKDHIDTGLCSALGISVHTPSGYCTEEVADHALALSLALLRGLRTTFSEEDWDTRRRAVGSSLRRLSSLRAGVIGTGRIGSAIARRLLAFGFDVVGHDSRRVDSPVPQVSRADLLRSCDLIVLATSGDDGTIVLGADDFATMECSPVIVNIARGSVIDEAALLDALNSGRVRSAGLDVRTVEPPPCDDALAQHGSVLVTPHVAASSQESRTELARRVADLAVNAVAGEDEFSTDQPVGIR